MQLFLRRLVPTGSWVLALIAPLLVFVATGLQRSYQTDFWHHLARGRVIVTQGDILNHDIFTYTVPGQGFQDANWLTQVIYYGLFSAGGLPLVQFVNSLTLAVVLGILVWFCWRVSGSVRLAALLGGFTFFGIWQVLVIRPQTFSLLLFIILYGVLDASARRPWLLVVPPIILGLWANMHGGFPIGFLPIGCFLLAAAWEAWRAKGWEAARDRYPWALGACLLASLLATLVNPYGWRVYEYVATVSTVAAGRPIQEWQPPGLFQVIGKVWAASVLLLIASFGWSPRRPSARDLILVVCFFPPSCSAIRMVPWWLLIVAPIVAAQLAAALGEKWLRHPEDEQPSAMAGVFVALFGLIALVSTPLMEPVGPVAQLMKEMKRDRRTEDDLEALVRQHLPAEVEPGQGNIFSRLEWGEYLGWALQPAGYRVFIDGRIEIFPAPVWDEYMGLTRGQANWQEILDHYGVRYLILEEKDPDTPDRPTFLLTQVRQSKKWKQVGQQGNAILFERQH